MCEDYDGKPSSRRSSMSRGNSGPGRTRRPSPLNLQLISENCEDLVTRATWHALDMWLTRRRREMPFSLYTPRSPQTARKRQPNNRTPDNNGNVTVWNDNNLGVCACETDVKGDCTRSAERLMEKTGFQDEVGYKRRKLD